MAVSGTRFTRATVVRLQGPGGSLAARSVTLVDADVLTAVFDLTGPQPSTWSAGPAKGAGATGEEIGACEAPPGSPVVRAYLRAATPLTSKSKTFEPGPTSRIRVLLVLYCSGTTDTSSSTSSDGMVGFRTFLAKRRVLRISTRYLPGRRPRLISYFPSLLIPPPPPGPGVPSIGIHAIDPVVSGWLSNRTVPVTVGSASRRCQAASATPPRASNPPAASQTRRAFLTVETPCHDCAPGTTVGVSGYHREASPARRLPCGLGRNL